MKKSKDQLQLRSAHCGKIATLIFWANSVPSDFIHEFAIGAGLMTCGTDFADSYRRFGGYIGCILKGEKPAELPVQQPTRFELVITSAVNPLVSQAAGFNFGKPPLECLSPTPSRPHPRR